MSLRHVLPCAVAASLVSTATARPPESGEHGGSLTLIPLKRSVTELVHRFYPKASSYTFGDRVGFEHATRVYVSEAIAKAPAGVNPPLVEVRGPMAGGVWCSMDYVSGSLAERAAYARAEGEIERRGFKELRFYQDYEAGESGAPACHLIVTLRMPADSGKKEEGFVKELRALLKAHIWAGPQKALQVQHRKLETSTGGAVHPEAIRKALEAIEGAKIDPNTSGPVHPETIRAAVEAIEGELLKSGLRVHPSPDDSKAE